MWAGGIRFWRSHTVFIVRGLVKLERSSTDEGMGRPILEIPYSFYCERSCEVGVIQYRCGQGASDFGDPIQFLL